MEHVTQFKSYGVCVELRSNDEALIADALSVAKTSLLGAFEITRSAPVDQVFELSTVGRGRTYKMRRNDGDYVTSGESRPGFLKFFDSMIRVSVAEAAHRFVFLHAGVVGWRGKAIVMPANSFHGKSTLVKALVSLGAEYYSDDFAVVDRRGLVHPFARPISLRAADVNYTPYEIMASDIGGTTGTSPLPIGMIFLAFYKFRSRWNPRILGSGEGVLGTLPFAISMRKRPELCLQVLNLVASRAIIASSSRGEAGRCAKKLLDFFDKYAN